MKVYEVLADALVAEGIEVCFGLLGGGNAGLIWELQQRGVRFVPTRHEQGAVGMADGYARATGKIGFVSISHGPGLSNAATPMISARHSRSAVLIHTSDTPPTNRHNNMNFEQAPFILSTAGAIQELARPKLLSESVELCFRHLRSGRGPIVLDTPDDIIDGDAPEGMRYEPTGLANVPRQPVAPAPEQVAKLAGLVRSSQRPVVLAGRGALWSGAHGALVQLADQIGAVLTTSLLTKSYFDGHPYNVGISGGFALPGTGRILRDADLVMAFGTSLSKETIGHGSTYPNAHIAQIDLDPVVAMDQTVANTFVVGDCRLTAEAMFAALEQQDGWRGPELADRIAAIDQWEGIDFAENPGFINPYRAYQIADELLPRERLLMVDGGYFMGGPPVHISVQDPRDLVLPWKFGAIGGATGPAIGAAIGRPDRTVVLFTGDGGFMMNVQEIDTAVRANAPLIIFVVNNGGFAMERPYYRNKGWAPEMADYDNPDFGAVARAFGLDGYLVRSSDDLTRALRAIGTPKRPTLVDLKVKRDAQYLEIDRYSSARPAVDPARRVVVPQSEPQRGD